MKTDVVKEEKLVDFNKMDIGMTLCHQFVDIAIISGDTAHREKRFHFRGLPPVQVVEQTTRGTDNNSRRNLWIMQGIAGRATHHSFLLIMLKVTLLVL